MIKGFITSIILLFLSFQSVSCENLPNNDFVFNYEVVDGFLAFEVKRKDGVSFSYDKIDQDRRDFEQGSSLLHFYIVKDNKEIDVGGAKKIEVYNRSSSFNLFFNKNNTKKLIEVINLDFTRKYITEAKINGDKFDLVFYIYLYQNNEINKPVSRWMSVKNNYKDSQFFKNCYVFKTKTVTVDIKKLTHKKYILVKKDDELTRLLDLGVCANNKNCFWDRKEFFIIYDDLINSKTLNELFIKGLQNKKEKFKTIRTESIEEDTEINYYEFLKKNNISKKESAYCIVYGDCD